MFEILNELEEVNLKVEATTKMLGMICDCATESLNSLDNYNEAFWLLEHIAHDYTNKLIDIHKRLVAMWRESKQEVTV